MFLPVEVISSWPAPEYRHPQDVRGHQMVIVACIFYPITLIVVGIRVVTRLRMRSFGIEDVLLLPAIFMTTACTVLASKAVNLGWNRHLWDIPPPMLVAGLKMTIALECLLGAALTFTKLSFLVLMRKMVSGTHKALRIGALAGIIAVVCELVSFNFGIIFACRPVSAYWTISIAPQQCINELTYLFIGGFFNTLTDMFVLLLPIPLILSTQMHTRQKILISFVYVGGIIAFIAGIAKIRYSWDVNSSYDRTWNYYSMWIPSMLELYFGLICAALAGYAPTLSRFFPAALAPPIRQVQPLNHNSCSGSIFKRFPSPPNFSADKAAFFDTPIPFELRSPNKPAPSRYGARVDSRQMLPLTYLERSPESDRESKQSQTSQNSRGSGKRSSTRTSLSSFITVRGPIQSPSHTMSTFDFGGYETENFPLPGLPMNTRHLRNADSQDTLVENPF